MTVVLLAEIKALALGDHSRAAVSLPFCEAPAKVLSTFLHSCRCSWSATQLRGYEGQPR